VIGNCSITPAKWAYTAAANTTFSKTLAIVGAPVGAFGAYALMLLIYLFDPRVRDKKELLEYVGEDLPLLGEVTASEPKKGGLL
jgi:capsular polysaccharide biosynthesis protein